MDSKKFSNNMLARMPVYLNYIKGLPQSTKNISATKIANALGLGEVSVRKDLAKVSDGGRCKLGYSCEELIEDIESFLGVKSALGAVLVGKGEMLRILLNYEGFGASGLNIMAGFDIDGSRKRGNEDKCVYPMSQLESFCMKNGIQIGILIVPAENAQEVCDRLVDAGVEGIWNFTPAHLNVPKHVVLQNESVIASVTKLRMQLREKKS